MQPSPSASDTSTATSTSAASSPPTARPSPSRGFSSFLLGPEIGASRSPAPSSTGSDVFVPPLSPEPTPPQPASQPHTPGSRTMPLVGEAQGWAYPMPYPPMPMMTPYMAPYTPYTPYANMPYLNAPYGQTPYNMATPLPPQAPFQPTTIHNTPYASYTPLRPSTYTPYAPPQPQLPSYSTPFAPPRQLPANSTPYAPPPAPLPSYSTPYAPAPVQLPYTGPAPAPYGAPVQPPVVHLQPSYLSIHSAIISLGLGACSLHWDLIHPVFRCRLTSDAYTRVPLSEPILSMHPSLRIKIVRLEITSSSHPNLAYWMDIWGPLKLEPSPIPTIGDVLSQLHTYFRMPMSPTEISLLFQTPQNKENVLQAKQQRVKEGFDLILAEEGYRRSDVLGVHRQFGGIWVGGVRERERVDGDGAEEGEVLVEVELMVGVTPCTRS
ncbi:hypothetical protein Moror_12320 [Moniliophthora roreri MCA 2997]|uniref:DUF6699 domain-containing protein n=2 Tax=Moniliophthora roreri TaxID=221103 RepID=V2XQ95_MONRO|nr:hypothetical protein Moror_12320 [Moniliophthora roreri MCA 2997]